MSGSTSIRQIMQRLALQHGVSRRRFGNPVTQGVGRGERQRGRSHVGYQTQGLLIGRVATVIANGEFTGGRVAYRLHRLVMRAEQVVVRELEDARTVLGAIASYFSCRFVDGSAISMSLPIAPEAGQAELVEPAGG